MTETLLCLSISNSIIYLSDEVGVFAGWTVNEKLHEYMYASEEERTVISRNVKLRWSMDQ